MARNPRKNTIPLTEESVRRLRDKEEDEEENDGFILVARVKKDAEAPKANESMKAAKILFCGEGVSGRELVKVLESSFFEEMIREARALKTISIKGGHGREDPFHDYFTGVENATVLSDLEVSRKDFGEASCLFDEASALPREACSRSRAELSRYEADLRTLTGERNALRLLCEQREQETKDLRVELTEAHQDQTDLTEQVMKILKTHGFDSGLEANISISQLQQKLEMIGQLREEVDIIKAEILGWKESMDRLAAEKEAARAQLSSAESQLQGMRERSSVQARKIEELEARLASELAKAKSEAEKAKAEADTFVVVYPADAEAAQVQAREAAETAQTRAYWVVEHAKCQSRRETLEKIHARGYDLTEEIKKTKELEADARALASDNYDDNESKSGSESGEEFDGEETAPGDNQEPQGFFIFDLFV
ncbi:uncharacterized protein [Nicotiana tomentosiformis]|uniref:uncharacterized protein n=1 Tax=Nicotiana tomentosiformis TaxID=4098 RepID=UPI00388C707D